MNYLSLKTILLGCLVYAIHAEEDEDWCNNYKGYCDIYPTLRTSCPHTCNIHHGTDPSWCAQYKSYCSDNESVRRQCPRTCDGVHEVNGGWGTWSDWEDCSAECGGGMKERSRHCNNPSPSNGGDKCALSRGSMGMEESMEKPCNMHICEVDGGYSSWSAYSKCSKSCGGGIQYKNRCCTTPFPKNGGDDCSELGSPVEARICNTINCPIHGNYTEWVTFIGCSKSCGGGILRRKRTCSNPMPRFGGDDCREMGDSFRTVSCNTEECPVHGGYTDWTRFSECSEECGKGIQYRSRCCVDPEPDNGGNDCTIIGEPVEVKSCMSKPCSIDGGWSEWEEYGVCTKSCGDDGVKMRKRTCNHPPPLFDGDNCEGIGFQTLPCNRQACSVDGGLSDWSDWESCTVSCGSGTQFRKRECDDPEPSGGGRQCDGPTWMTSECNGMPCPINGVWSSWESHGICTAPCGDTGVRLRRRYCNSPAPMFNGNTCAGSGMESEACNRMICKVDGGLTHWSSWGDCSSSCGNGTQVMTRSCTNPPPQNGGDDCDGPLVLGRACNSDPCPVYKYGLELKSWDAAEDICVTWGGHLASVMSEEEMETIIDGFKNKGVSVVADIYVWIGANDKASTNSWQWIDGTPTGSYIPWGNGEPSHTDHHCVSANIYSKSWWDRMCPNLYRYVCKK